MQKFIPVSVIIPAFNYKKSLKIVLDGVNNQKVLPRQIIIIDSSKSNDVEKMILNYYGKVEILYHRISKAFPGEARNLGAKMASEKWLAFLDSKTVPNRNWLMDSFDAVSTSNVEVIFGLTQYISKTSSQDLIKAAVYGNYGVETTPGTLVSNEDFIKLGGFLEGVRTADDLEWRDRIKGSGLKYLTPKRINLTYSEISDNLYENIKRFFVYQLYTATVNVQNTVKTLYLSLLLIFSATIIPNWNTIVGWEKSFFYIPNITKVYLTLLAVVLLFNILLNKVFFKTKSKRFLSTPLKVIALIFLTLTLFNWNSAIAGWEEDGLLYIPHISKIYLGLLVLSSIIYRGIYFPIIHGIHTNYLFPFRWISVGFLGLIFDIVKAPGYTIGALIHLFKIR